MIWNEFTLQFLQKVSEKEFTHIVTVLFTQLRKVVVPHLKKSVFMFKMEKLSLKFVIRDIVLLRSLAKF